MGKCRRHGTVLGHYLQDGLPSPVLPQHPDSISQIPTLETFSCAATMTVITPLYAMLNRLGQLALQDSAKPSPQTHFELLQMIDQLKSAVETPTETVLRLIYQVEHSVV